MSRVGRQLITLPTGVTATLAANTLTVKGPKGTLTREFKPVIEIKIDGSEIRLAPRTDSGLKAGVVTPLWGTYASHVKNMVTGATTGFVKTLLIEGVGFKAAVAGDTLTLDLGFSHPIKLKVPAGIAVTVEKGTMTITGADKEQVGQFTATVRAYKPTEPYKGKGIRYSDETVIRKQGKKNLA